MSFAINFSAVNTLLTGIPKLNDDNWFEWSKKMNMMFVGVGIPGISSGNRPTDAELLTSWKVADHQMIAFIYLKVEDEYHHLIDDLESAAEAWSHLKEHFEHSTMGQRMKARQEFYSISHDPSRPIAFYFQAVLAARKKMETFGCKIDDTEAKDVLLMHLDPSFHSIRTIILTQKTEPSLAEVKSSLLSLGVVDSVEVKVKHQGFAAHGRSQQPGGGVGLRDKEGIENGGFRWCDPTGEECQRCGRPGHPAFHCMFNMPQDVKDHLMGTSRSKSPQFRLLI